MIESISNKEESDGQDVSGESISGNENIGENGASAMEIVGIPVPFEIQPAIETSLPGVPTISIAIPNPEIVDQSPLINGLGIVKNLLSAPTNSKETLNALVSNRKSPIVLDGSSLFAAQSLGKIQSGTVNLTGVASSLIANSQTSFLSALGNIAQSHNNWASITKAIAYKPPINWQEKLAHVLTHQQEFTKAISAWNINNKFILDSNGGNFIVPDTGSIASFGKFKSSLIGLQTTQERFSLLTGVLSEISKPWLNIERPEQSIAGISSLLNIGSKLAGHVPFGKVIPELLRDRFGDWRKEGILPPEFVQNETVKQKFFNKVGFDATIAEFPKESYFDILEATGIVSLEELSEGFSDESVPQHGLQRNTFAHKHLTNFEVKIRQFVELEMRTNFGDDWCRKKLQPDMWKSWEERKEKHENNFNERYKGSLIEFADFTDYVRIITKRDFWRDVFQSKFGKRRVEDVQESFHRLGPIRVEVAHSRPVGNKAVLLLIVETDRILTAINYK